MRATRLAFACLAGLALPASAWASVEQETLLQDDPLIVYADYDDRLDRVFTTLKALGVDRVRASVFWNLVAPNPKGLRKPSFGRRGPAWPDSYPRSAWERYDRIVLLARRHGLGVLFTVTGPAPAWATAARSRGYSVYRPKAREFRHFVTAVGRRYSGTWTDAAPPSPQPSPNPLPVAPPLTADARQAQQQTSSSEPLPRVDHWSIWNEPNFPTWLSPQSRRTRLPEKHGLLPVSPHRYRGLVDAGYSGLRASGHASDQILIGELAPRGGRPGVNTTIQPVPFIRELYCVDGRFRRFRGARARARGCPDTRAERARFRASHPGLFGLRGLAHHPYSLNHRPTWKHPSRQSIPLGSINRLIDVWDRARFAWGDIGQGSVWITEYGYQTAPDPYAGIPFERQALWTTWAELIAYRNPRIASMGQFLLNDDRPDTQWEVDSYKYWRTWQSGLMTSDGQPKPAFYEFPLPIHVTPTRPRQGRSVRVFGAARPAPESALLSAHVQGGGPDGQWTTIKEVKVDSVRNYLYTRVVPPGATSLRILWVDPASGYSVGTRAVPIRPR